MFTYPTDIKLQVGGVSFDVKAGSSGLQRFVRFLTHIALQEDRTLSLVASAGGEADGPRKP